MKEVTNQRMFIFRMVAPYDEILNRKDAYFDEEENIYASARYLAQRELNKYGYRVLQFLITEDSLFNGEWVLVEKVI